MNNSKIKVNTSLGIVDYIQVVNEILLEYFNIDGVYQPHIGMLNAMRVFYNTCVIEDESNKQYNDNADNNEVLDVFDMENIINNDEFITEFNNAIITNGVKLDFANAYKQALEIVATKKTSLGNAIEIICNSISEFLNSIEGTFSGESLDKITNIAEKISNGNINANTIVEAYAQSQRFKDVVNSKN